MCRLMLSGRLLRSKARSPGHKKETLLFSQLVQRAVHKHHSKAKVDKNERNQPRTTSEGYFPSMEKRQNKLDRQVNGRAAEERIKKR